MAETRASPSVRVVCSPRHAPTSSGQAPVSLYATPEDTFTWCHHTREAQKGGGGERKTWRDENLARGKLISVRLPPLVPGRPPCAPVIIAGYLRSHQETQRTQSQSPEMPQERHLHHRRTILSKEACEQTSRESSSAAETTNQPFNTSTGVGLAMTAIDGWNE